MRSATVGPIKAKPAESVIAEPTPRGISDRTWFITAAAILLVAALLRRPPTLFPSHFGSGSFDKHVAEAHRTGATLMIIELPRVALDIDDPGDIAELGRVGRGSVPYELVMRMLGWNSTTNVLPLR